MTLHVEGYHGGDGEISANYGYECAQSYDSLIVRSCGINVAVAPFAAEWSEGDPDPEEPWEDPNGDTAEHCGGDYPSVGSIIPLDDWDGNENGIPDYLDAEPWCAIHCSNAVVDATIGEPIHMSAPSGGQKVRVYVGLQRYTLPCTVPPDLAWIEGVQPSGSPGDIELRVQQTLPGPSGYVIEDWCKCTVVKTNLTISGRSEEDEETDPRPMAKNDDDDNLNNVCDLSENPLLKDGNSISDDELVEMTGEIEPTGLQGTWRLDSDPLGFWTNASNDAAFPYTGAVPFPSGAFLVECLTHGSFTTSLVYRPEYSRGPYSDPVICAGYEKSDTVKIDGLDPEIDLLGLDDCQEVTTGGFVILNDNDNDGITGSDLASSGPTPSADSDLAEVEISFAGPIPDGADREMELSASGSGSEKIRVWSDRHKTQECILPLTIGFDAGMLFIDGRYVKYLYVEGIEASGGANDVELKVTYVRDSINFIDRLKLTVVDVVFDAPADGDDKAVLISKTPGMGDDYPDPDLQTEDRKIRIEAHTVPPIRDLPLCFASWDPDDESPYETDTNGNDNADGSGTIYAVPGYIYEGQPGQTLTVYSDPNGNIKLKLEITSHCSGDNYFLTARALTPPDETEDKTGTMVAWKRVYLEIDRMYAKGSYVDGFPVTPGSCEIPVASTLDYEGGPMVAAGDTVLLFDNQGQSEQHTVASVGQSLIITQEPAVGEYLPGPCSGVAVLAAGAYHINTEWLEKPLGSLNGSMPDVLRCDEAWGGVFVDCWVVPGALNPNPYVPHKNVLGVDVAGFTEPWFDCAAQSNVIHCVAVDHCILGFDSQLLGLSEKSRKVATVCSGRIWRLGEEADRREIGRSLAHEVVHQFYPTRVDRSHAHLHVVDGYKHCLMDTYGPEHEFQFDDNGPCELCYWDPNCPDQEVSHVEEVRRCHDPLVMQ